MEHKHQSSGHSGEVAQVRLRGHPGTNWRCCFLFLTSDFMRNALVAQKIYSMSAYSSAPHVQTQANGYLMRPTPKQPASGPQPWKTPTRHGHHLKQESCRVPILLGVTSGAAVSEIGKHVSESASADKSEGLYQAGGKADTMSRIWLGKKREWHVACQEYGHKDPRHVCSDCSCPLQLAAALCSCPMQLP